jgi:hypothetical protein
MNFPSPPPAICVRVDGRQFGMIELSLTPNMTFAQVKPIIEERLGIPRSWQSLMSTESFHARRGGFDDSQTLQEFTRLLSPWPLLVLSRHGHVRVAYSGGRPFLPVDIFLLRDTVQDVKRRIEGQFEGPGSIPAAEQRILFEGAELRDDLPLVDLPGKTPLWGESLLRLAVRAAETIEVRVQAVDGRSIQLVARTSDSVFEVKEQIEEQEAIPIARQRLLWGSQELKNDRVLGDFHIANGVTLHLRDSESGAPVSAGIASAKVGSPIEISVNNVDDGTVSSVRVLSTDPISSATPSLPSQAAAALGTRAWVGGEELDPGKSFEDYSIRNGMVVHLETGMRIYVVMLTGKQFTMYVRPATTIEELKVLIQSQERIPADQQKLVWAGKLLEGEHTIADFGIRGECTLHLVLKLRG